jgi:hypothetical protein
MKELSKKTGNYSEKRNKCRLSCYGRILPLFLFLPPTPLSLSLSFIYGETVD